jgi:hypothetical protein
MRAARSTHGTGDEWNHTLAGIETERSSLGALSADRALIKNESELVGWIHLAQNRDWWLYLVNAAVKIRVP